MTLAERKEQYSKLLNNVEGQLVQAERALRQLQDTRVMLVARMALLDELQADPPTTAPDPPTA